MPGTALVTIGENEWNVELATTTTELTTGLSGRASIPIGQGMLFDLGSERIVTVNAYEMLFPISVVFIGENSGVTEITQLLTPGYDITTNLPCRYFLEVNTGEAASIEVGDAVTIAGYTPPTGSTINMETVVVLMIVAMMAQMMLGLIEEV